ncbi:MAG: hypothetical protein OK438_07885 [Thaumarchaeota archaeon]|nr:hypothetical protein [Nitrososphaerota archaeon]
MKRRGKKRFGNLAFFVPVVLLVAVILFGLYQNLGSGNGTLVVEAQSSYGSSSHFISALATVSGATKQTPFSLSVKPGPYTVTYGDLQWYWSPPPKTVTVLGGTSAYAVGVYVPIPVIVGVNGPGFNVTQVNAKSGITPLVWIDTTVRAVQLKSSMFNVMLSPGQNYTRVFTVSEKLIVTIPDTGATMTVNVA